MQHKLAIIGYGGMGSWHHRSVAEKIPQITVKGAWDIQESARQKAVGNGLYAYSSLDELLSDGDIDIVTIAVPNNFHKDLSIACLRAGKATICEKPVTMNAAELEDVIAVSKETGKLFSVHQNRRWDKDYVIARRILSDGTIGRPYFIESRVQGSRGAMHGWRGYKLNGGGMVLDWGVHILDQIMQLVDSPVVGVHAHLLSIFTPEVEDNIKIFIQFENDVCAMLEMVTNCLVKQPRWHISCTDGTAVIEDWSCDGRMVQIKTGSELAWADDIVYTEAGPTRTMAPRPEHTTVTIPLPEVTSDWAEYYRNIVSVLDRGEELIVKPEQALRVMKVIDLIFESHRAGYAMKCRI